MCYVVVSFCVLHGGRPFSWSVSIGNNSSSQFRTLNPLFCFVQLFSLLSCVYIFFQFLFHWALPLLMFLLTNFVFTTFLRLVTILCMLIHLHQISIEITFCHLCKWWCGIYEFSRFQLVGLSLCRCDHWIFFYLHFLLPIFFTLSTNSWCKSMKRTISSIPSIYLSIIRLEHFPWTSHHYPTPKLKFNNPI